MRKVINYVKVINIPTFNEEFYNSLFRKKIYGNLPPITINTIDLAAMFPRMNSDIECELSREGGYHPWRSLTCLSILAKEGLIDLSIFITDPDTYWKDGNCTIINLTDPEDPYWVFPNIFGGYDHYKEEKLPTVWLSNPHISKQFYAKPIDNALEKLLEKANNDWFKIWYTYTPLPESAWEMNLAVNRFPILPDNCIVVDESKEVTYNLWSLEQNL